jgi:TonB family protein
VSLLTPQVGPDFSIADARELALDQIGPRITADPVMAASFWEEAGESTSPENSGVTVFYFLFHQGSATCGLLEFVSGQSVEQLLSQGDPSSCERAIPLFCRLLDACDLAALENAALDNAPVASPPRNKPESRWRPLRPPNFGIVRASAPAPGKLYGSIMIRPDGSLSEEILSDECGRSSTYPVLMAVYEELLGGLPEGAALIPAQLDSFSNRSLAIPENPGLFERSLPYVAAFGAGAVLILGLSGLGRILASRVESGQAARLQLPSAPTAVPVAAIEGTPRQPAPSSEIPAIQTRVAEDGPTRSSSLIYQISPEYSAEARRQGASGLVKLEITIAETGFVRTAKVLSGSPSLARSAVDAVKKWVYQPALVNGKPTSVTKEVEFQFDLDRLPIPTAVNR